MPAAPIPTATPARPHLYWVDWMRFLAAAVVLLDHACEANWSGPAMSGAAGGHPWLKLLTAPMHPGREAVIVFFVLSGALVGGLTLRKIRAGTFDAGAYAADRLARVYVPLIPALLLTAATVRMIDRPLYPLQYLGCLFGLQRVLTREPSGNGVLWTLAYEMWFYVLAGCAAVVAVRWKRPLRAWLAPLTGGVLALGILCWRLEWVYLACWLLGATGMWLSDRIGKSACPGGAAAGLVLLLAGTALFRPDFCAAFPTLELINERFPLSRLTVAAGTLLFLASVCRWVPTTRAGAWLERLGTPPAAFSYTLYLVHFPVLGLLLRTTDQLPTLVTWQSLVRLGWWMAICVVVAVVMYALFERQTPRVRAWLRTRLSAMSPVGSPVAGQTPLPAL